MKYNCLNNISKLGLNFFSSSYFPTEEVDNAELILVRSFNMLEMSFSPKLLAVARAGAGVNNIPLGVLADLGVVVFNTPGANSNGVKELAIAGMLMSARDLFGGINWVKNNREDKDILKTIEKAKQAFSGNEILGKTILIVGLGAIGAKLANACYDLGLKVYGYDPYLTEDARRSLSSGVELTNNLEDLYGVADYVSLHVPLVDDTKEMINKEVLLKMKMGSVLLNFSRDKLVKDVDLAWAISEGIIKHYITDFPNHFVANLDRVIAFPHLGASTDESEENCAIMAVKQLMAYVEKGEIINSVNYPNVKMDNQHVDNRMIILAKNNPTIAREISRILQEIEQQLESRVSKVRGDYAYYAFDISGDLNPVLISKIEAIEGINKVRIIKK